MLDRIAREGLVPYVIAAPATLRRLDRSPLGLSIEPENVVDPTRTRGAPLLDAVHRLDALVFGPRGLATPRWALYDCAELPGVVAGLSRAGEPASLFVAI